MKNAYSLLKLLPMAVAIVLAACKSSNKPEPTTPAVLPTDPGTLSFNSGFESGTSYNPYAYTYCNDGSSGKTCTNGGYLVENDNIKGVDASVQGPNDWSVFSKSSTGAEFAGFSVTYDRGDSTKRNARIVTDPTNAANHVLRYKMLDTFVPQGNTTSKEKKGRVEARLSSKTGQTDFYQQVKFYVPNDWQKFNNGTVDLRYQGAGFITIFEFFGNGYTGSDGLHHQLYCTVGLCRKAATAGSPLCFELHAADYDNASGHYSYEWHAPINDTLPLPINKWMTIEVYLKQGKNNTGRFYLAVTPEGGQRKVVYDAITTTQLTDDQTTNGWMSFSPMKLYANSVTVDYMNAQGGIFQAYWDDYKLWKGRRP